MIPHDPEKWEPVFGQDHAAMTTEDRHLPQAAAIDAYGTGGFRFADMSHRGSILCLPDGIWAWPVTDPALASEETLARVFAQAGELDFFVFGTGAAPWIMPEPLRARFRAAQVSLDTMSTGAAVRTYNVMLMENRRVGAGLIAIA
jgi:uncharacterized protein